MDNFAQVQGTFKEQPQLQQMVRSLRVEHLCVHHDKYHDFWYGVHEQTFRRLLTKLPTLQRLEVSDFSPHGNLLKKLLLSNKGFLPQAETLCLSLSGQALKAIGTGRVLQMPKLKTLLIRKCSFSDLFRRDSIEWHPDSSSSQHLSLVEPSEYFNSNLEKVSKACISLSSLHIILRSRVGTNRMDYGNILSAFSKHLHHISELKELTIVHGTKTIARYGCEVPFYQTSSFEYLGLRGLHSKLKTIRMAFLCLFNNAFDAGLEHLPESLRHLTLHDTKISTLQIKKIGNPASGTLTVLGQLIRNLQRLGTELRVKLPVLQDITLEIGIASIIETKKLHGLL